MSEELKDDTIQSTEKDQTIKKSNNESVEDVPETGEEGTKRETEEDASMFYVDFDIIMPDQVTIRVPNVSISEPIGVLKQTLFEYVETACYTAFSLALKVDDDFTKLHEFAEISTVISSKTTKLETLHMIPEDYDVKQLRYHVKKLREIISSPPITRGALVKSGDKSKTNKPSKNDKNEAAGEQKNPNSDEIELLMQSEKVGNSIKLSEFYKEILFRTGKYIDQFDNGNYKTQQLSDVIKSVSLSAWNPPPPHRKLQGDLVYIEVATAEDGIFQITATNCGFFVNSSNRLSFDPRPSSTIQFFSHELLHLILLISPTVRQVWSSSLKAIDNIIAQAENETNQFSGALDLIATLYGKGKGDQIQLVPQWNIPSDDVYKTHPLSKGSNPSCTIYKHHTNDIGRVIDEMTDNFGVDERGAAREWNDEIQPMRELSANDLQQKVTKAKFIHKIITEFIEASKVLVSAIFDGHISPLNIGDTESSLIYVYNGIFMSRAVDTKDTFRVCVGEDACRKGAALDVNNQKHIMSLGVDGVSTVLTAIIDFRGERFIAQSIIPGVLSAGSNSARLVYGVLESGKRISCKTSVQPILDAMAKKLFLKRNLIPIVAPTTTNQGSNEVSNQNQPIVGEFLSQLDNDKGSPIRVDEENEVAEKDATSLSHVGPIEGKLLQGSDSRVYALDMVRLTPRDANYVKGDRGTGNISEEWLNTCKEDLFPVYILRHELIASYVQNKINTLRHQVLVDAANHQRPTKTAEATDSTDKSTDASKASDDKEENDSSLDLKYTEEVLLKYNAITMESINLQLNTNVFLPNVVADINPDEVEKDEETARDLARYLFTEVLPNITYQIRAGEMMISDNVSMVEMLHNQGVNMRYLGQLARLAKEQELEDVYVAKENKQRIHAMPKYWLELLEIEMIARAVKHLLRRLYQSNKRVQMTPTTTIISVLNHLFGHDDLSAAATGSEQSKETHSSTQTTTSSQPSLTKSAKKRQKAKAATMKALPTVSVIPEIPDATTDRRSTLQELVTIIRERYCYELSLAHFSAGDSKPFLSTRMNRQGLLRRLCQVNGLRLASKDYDLDGLQSSTPFGRDDLVNILPRVKSCEPDATMMELREYIMISRSLLQERNLQGSFEYAQEVNHWLQQIVGSVHREILLPIDQMTGIFLTAGDFLSALGTASKGLQLSVQVYGLDSNEALQHHIQLAIIYMELKHFQPAIQHLYSARYLTMLLGGENHPEMASIYNHLALISKELNAYDLSMTFYQTARKKVTDLNKHSVITESLAEVYLKLGKLDEALREQRVSYNVIGGILGQTDPKTNESKDRLEKYRRAVTERNVTIAKEQREREEKRRLESFANPNPNAMNSDGQQSHGAKKFGKKSNHKASHRR